MKIIFLVIFTIFLSQPMSLPKEGDWVCMAEAVMGPDTECDAMDHDPNIEIAKKKAIKFCKGPEGCDATECRIVRCMKVTRQ